MRKLDNTATLSLISTASIILMLCLVVSEKSDASHSIWNDLNVQEQFHLIVPPAENLSQPRKYEETEKLCLAQNIFWEARGVKDNLEFVRIANVTTNRIRSNFDGNSTYCGAVHQKNSKGILQFSWTKDNKNLKTVFKKEPGAEERWEYALQVADYELAYGFPDITKGSLYYKAIGCKTKGCVWMESLKLLVTSTAHKYFGAKEVKYALNN